MVIRESCFLWLMKIHDWGGGKSCTFCFAREGGGLACHYSCHAAKSIKDLIKYYGLITCNPRYVQGVNVSDNLTGNGLWKKPALILSLITYKLITLKPFVKG